MAGASCSECWEPVISALEQGIGLIVTTILSLSLGVGSVLYIISMEIGIAKLGLSEGEVTTQIGQWAPLVVEAWVILVTVFVRFGTVKTEEATHEEEELGDLPQTAAQTGREL